MRSFFTRNWPLALLLAFVTSLGNWSFNVERLVHVYEHQVTSPGFALAGGSAHRDQAPDGDADHERLHAESQTQPCPMPCFDWPQPSREDVVRSAFLSFAVARAVGDPPFRPPRGLSEFA